MAESTGSKNKKTLDAFADDLDAMLNIADDGEQAVGEIDDDEAIDRLLVGDEPLVGEEETEIDEFADIDSLLDDLAKRGEPVLADDVDEFGDDLAADIAINPSLDQQVAIDDEFADIVEPENLSDSIEIDVDRVFDEAAKLEQVGEIDEFADEVVAQPSAKPLPSGDELESMTEIDEFGDELGVVGNNADFLIADFDISADDDFVAAPALEEEIADSELPAVPDFESYIPTSEPEVSDEEGADVGDTNESAAEEAAVTGAEPPLAAPPLPIAPAVQMVDHGEEIAGLSRQIVDLKKHQQQFRHDMTELAGKSELLGCVESLEKLETEQKKTKRAVDGLAAKKPVAAYVANGVAALALLIGTLLGVQGMIAKSQVGELAAIIGKLQEQVNAAPTSDAADKEMLRKQLDELTVSSGVMSNQIAELNKALHSAPQADKGGSDAAKPSPELGNQIMQIGATIETLQNKVSALEKGRSVAAAPAPKPEKKKPEPVEENWAVNLVAFKQDWYAKSKAQEFAGKGVPAKVVKTESKGENWYRLYVDGFKSQYEAAAYAAKIKKTLNLDSVWVTRNKE